MVIDEFHHAEAASYRRLLDHVQPIELLGLTATPERGDGVDVREFFEWRVAAELRLWEALEQNLLCPFHYFGIHDGVDLGAVQWRRGGYDLAALSNLYTGNDARTRIVLKELRDKVADVAAMRALGLLRQRRTCPLYGESVRRRRGAGSRGVGGNVSGGTPRQR